MLGVKRSFLILLLVFGCVNTSTNSQSYSDFLIQQLDANQQQMKEWRQQYAIWKNNKAIYLETEKKFMADLTDEQLQLYANLKKTENNAQKELINRQLYAMLDEKRQTKLDWIFIIEDMLTKSKAELRAQGIIIAKRNQEIRKAMHDEIQNLSLQMSIEDAASSINRQSRINRVLEENSQRLRDIKNNLRRISP